ncbi:uncharacterized [Tachysurus ichikawai]
MSLDSKQYLMCHRLREETGRVMAGADTLPAPLPSVQGLGTGPCLTGETAGSASTQHCQLLFHSFIQHRQLSQVMKVYSLYKTFHGFHSIKSGSRL